MMRGHRVMPCHYVDSSDTEQVDLKPDPRLVGFCCCCCCCIRHGRQRSDIHLGKAPDDLFMQLGQDSQSRTEGSTGCGGCHKVAPNCSHASNSSTAYQDMPPARALP